EVQVTVTDKAGESPPPRIWHLSLATKPTAVEPPLTIVATKPTQETLVLDEGARQEFAVRPRGADSAAERRVAQYVWRVGGVEQKERGPTMQFHAQQPAGERRTVAIDVRAVTETGRRSDPVEWSVEVAAPLVIEGKPRAAALAVGPREVVTMLASSTGASGSLRYQRTGDGRVQQDSGDPLTLPEGVLEAGTYAG